jgi:LmbE family N-acetylglucosaminyl deacetylase
MPEFYNAIYLSPHLDDVALSCGGQIFTQTAAGQSVLIVTIMAGDPPVATLSDFAHSLHERWELIADAVARRRMEDIASCRVLGADYVHWTTPDSIYRLHPVTGEPIYFSEADIFGAVHPAEADMVDKLAQQMMTLPGSGRILAPLAVGHHVDHTLTRAAAERVWGPGLLYYEDYPYASEPGALDAVLPADHTVWQAEVILLSEAALQARVESIAAFASQLSTFFNNYSDLVRQVEEHMRRVGGERVWRQAS